MKGCHPEQKFGNSWLKAKSIKKGHSDKNSIKQEKIGNELF